MSVLPSFGGNSNAINCNTLKSVCLNTLQLMLEPGTATQLVALDVRGHDGHIIGPIAGFFDNNHLDKMAGEAAVLSGRSKGVYFTFNPIRHSSNEHWNHMYRADKGMLACDSDILKRSLIMIDFDPRRPSNTSASDSEKNSAWQLACQVKQSLAQRGLPCFMVADSGNGYHLYYRVDLPVDDPRPKMLLKYLSTTFPSENVTIDTTVSKPSQLTKLFGTLAAKGIPTYDRPHRFSSIIEHCPGSPISTDALDLLLPTRCVQAPTQECTLQAVRTIDALERARRYLSRMPPSISGQGGHNRLFEAACRMVNGFALTESQAFVVLEEYNQRAEPPWSEQEIRHKITDAVSRKDDKQPGYLLTQSRPQRIATARGMDDRHTNQAVQSSTRPYFPVSLPDFIPVPTDFAFVPLKSTTISRPPGRPLFNKRRFIDWMYALGLYESRAFLFYMPSIVLTAASAGVAPPKGWLRRLANDGEALMESIEQQKRQLTKCQREMRELVPIIESAVQSGPDCEIPEMMIAEELCNRRNYLQQSIPSESCPKSCLMHGSPIKHEHFVLCGPEVISEVYGQFAFRDDDGRVALDFDRPDAQSQTTLLQALVKQNTLFHAYLPVEIFGQASGLTRRQIRLVQGLMRERTRTFRGHQSRSLNPESVQSSPGSRRSRKSCSEEIVRNACVRAPRKDAFIRCPYLDSERTYVSFGGNLKKLRGRGYRLIGQLNRSATSLGGWLKRVGYRADRSTKADTLWEWVQKILDDLSVLSKHLGIVTAAVDCNCRWTSLSELRQLVKRHECRPRLERLSLRVFAPSDYLIRWRKWFADKLGFSYIPGGNWSEPTAASCDNTRCITALEMRGRLRKARVKNKEIAADLGWTESRVSRQLSGKTRLSQEVIDAAEKRMRDKPQSGCDDDRSTDT